MTTKRKINVGNGSRAVSSINKLVDVCEKQEKTIHSLLDIIRANSSKLIAPNGHSSPIRIKRSYRKSAPVDRNSKEALDKEFKKFKYELFLDGLKQIGRPAMTKEIAQRLIKNPQFKSITRNKKRFMQFLYSSVSHFVKQGILKRKPVGEKSYEYSLKGKYALAA